MSEEYVVQEPGHLIMPFYLACDVSGSMYREIGTLNEGIRRLRRAIVATPQVDDVCQICIMSFSDTAEIIAPLGRLSESGLPTLTVEGGTDYGVAFRALARAITNDVARLKQEGYKVCRPCAFFLTDGMPLDSDWYQTFTNTLTYDRKTGRGMKAHPLFIPFGFREASPDVLKKLAYPPDRAKWYQAKSSSYEEALLAIFQVLGASVITSARTAEAGQPTIVQPPGQGSSFLYGDSEYDSDRLP